MYCNNNRVGYQKGFLFVTLAKKIIRDQKLPYCFIYDIKNHEKMHSSCTGLFYF